MEKINIVQKNIAIPKDIIEKYVVQLTDNQYVSLLYKKILGAKNEVERTEIGIDFWNDVKKMPQDTQQDVFKAYMEAAKRLPSVMENFYQQIPSAQRELLAA